MIGKTISHYKILEKLGAGGMGVVYKAKDTNLDRTVALKLLPPYLLTDREAEQRFISEAKAASSFDHPNICNIHDIGKNICITLLENNGFKVFDLGKDVETEKIVQEARKNQADIVALSAFVTRSKIVDFEVLRKTVKAEFAKKEKFIPLNMAAMDAGQKAAS